VSFERPPPGPNEEFWREYLAGGGDPLPRFGRRVFTLLPKDPRCRLCTAPFAGVGGSMMRLIGRRQSEGNPTICTKCSTELIRHHGGAEVEGTMLFADIRGSTSLAETMSPSQFHDLLERFYSVASRMVFQHDGVIDKFVGDELVATTARLAAAATAGEVLVSSAACTSSPTAPNHTAPVCTPAPTGTHGPAGSAWPGPPARRRSLERCAVRRYVLSGHECSGRRIGPSPPTQAAAVAGQSGAV
jgi:adenylate cyclase